MLRRVVVLRRVLVRRVVAAADVPAFKTEAKVDPRISAGEAFLAALRCIGLVVARSTEMRAKSLGHRTSVRRLGGVGLRRWVHELADGREQEIQEGEGCDYGGGEKRRAQPDEISKDAGAERGRWRDREGDKAGGGVHATE